MPEGGANVSATIQAWTSTPQKLTRAEPHRARVVFSYVVLDPRPVDIVLAAGESVGMQHLSYGAVAEQAGSQGHLEGQPIFALANVQHVPGICCTCYMLRVVLV